MAVNIPLQRSGLGRHTLGGRSDQDSFRVTLLVPCWLTFNPIAVAGHAPMFSTLAHVNQIERRDMSVRCSSPACLSLLSSSYSNKRRAAPAGNGSRKALVRLRLQDHHTVWVNMP